MGKLFGTDGIRGIANEYPITAEMAVAVGKAVAHLTRDSRHARIMIGKDSRISGDMLIHGVASGVSAMGLDAAVLGTFPTPGVAFMTVHSGAAAGIMISASHNPYEDNGIKVFDANGYKLSEKQENEIESLLIDEKLKTLSSGIRNTGKIFSMDDGERGYMAFLKQALSDGFSLNGMKIILDCANGATYRVAPELFTELGAEVETLFANPDGRNINDDCGSQHTETLQKRVVEAKADLGLAFDGDGDRLIAVDREGAVLTGDQILFICAAAMKKSGILKNNLVVSTVMSNLGFREGLSKLDIRTLAADVGDRHVMEKMKSEGALIGGEDSGHTIFLSHHTTGDGILTGLKLIQSMMLEKKPLSELASRMPVFPQILINVNVRHKPPLKDIPDIQKAILSVEKDLGQKGRVLVRYSGTQSMCRVMVEGPTQEETRKSAKYIADAVQKAIG